VKITARRIFDISIILLAALICFDLYILYIKYWPMTQPFGHQKLGNISVSPGGLSRSKALTILIHVLLVSFVLVQVGLFAKARYYALNNVPISLGDLFRHRYFRILEMLIFFPAGLCAVSFWVDGCERRFPVIRNDLMKLEYNVFLGLAWMLPIVIFVTFYQAEKKYLIGKTSLEDFLKARKTIITANLPLTIVVYFFLCSALIMWGYFQGGIWSKLCRALE
jgi:hypothetical protein